MENVFSERLQFGQNNKAYISKHTIGQTHNILILLFGSNCTVQKPYW